MKIRIPGVLLIPAVALGMAACEVEQTEEGELPEAEVEGGKLPEYEVKPADVDVGLDTSRVIHPDVDVNTRPDTTRTPR